MLLLLNLLIMKENNVNHKIKLKYDLKLTSFLELFEDRSYFQSIDNGVELYSEIEQILTTIGRDHPVIFLKYQQIFESYLIKPPIGNQQFSQKSLQSNSTIASKDTKSNLQQPGGTLVATTMEDIGNPSPLQVLINFASNNNNNNSNVTGNLNTTSNSNSNINSTKDGKISMGSKNVYFTAKGVDINIFLWESLLTAYNSLNPLLYYLSKTLSQEYSLCSSQKIFFEFSQRRQVSFYFFFYFSFLTLYLYFFLEVSWINFTVTSI